MHILERERETEASINEWEIVRKIVKGKQWPHEKEKEIREREKKTIEWDKEAIKMMNRI